MIWSAVLGFNVNTCFREVLRVVSFNKVLCFGLFARMRAFGSFSVVRSVFGVDSTIRSAVLSFDVNMCFREVSRILSFNKVLCFGLFARMRAFDSFGVLRSVFEVDSTIRSVILGLDANTRLRKVLYEIRFGSTLNRLRGPLGMIWTHF